VAGEDARPTDFSLFRVSQGLMKDCPEKFSGGTGFPACADRLAGAEARPTNLFMLYRWAKKPLSDCPKNSGDFLIPGP